MTDRYMIDIIQMKRETKQVNRSRGEERKIEEIQDEKK